MTIQKKILEATTASQIAVILVKGGSSEGLGGKGLAAMLKLGASSCVEELKMVTRMKRWREREGE